MNSFWTVAGFTMKNKFKGKSFLITTLIFVVILCIGSNLPYIISLFDKNSDKPANIGYAIDARAVEGTKIAEQLRQTYAAQDKPAIKLIEYPDTGSTEQNEKTLKAAVADKKIKGYLLFGPVNETGLPTVTYKSEKLMDEKTSQALEQGIQIVKTDIVLKDSGLTDQQKAMLLNPVVINTMQIAASDGAGGAGNGKTESQQGVDMGFVTLLLLLLFFGIMVSGQMIASEITAEKSSRVMEIIVTSVSPLKQMFGKIFGMFVVSLTQMVAYLVVVIININLPHNNSAFMQYNIDLSKVDPLLLVYGLLFYVMGFLLYATLFAAVGSIVSRTEDLGQAVMPITMLSLAGFYITTFSISNPDTMLVKVTSFIPFFSPFVMLLRVGLANPPIWQVIVSIAILLVSIYAAGWLSAKIYRTGVLLYGKRPSWKELRKAMKAYKV
ncbi:ABC transporter permease [Paenibacillus sp. MMO-58]|uniref:ABC transporter permease n=1 Tax=Paenibacillus sp. MMO-58 TaxID=3081290 RepID=UPI0030194623